MANGPKTELRQILGICEKCRYTVEEIMNDYPVGTGSSALESTGIITHGVGEVYLVVSPHRPTCPFHTNIGASNE